MKVGSESNTEAPFVPSTTTEPIPTTFRRRRPKIKPIETFDGVSIKQINKLQKNVESVPELEPLVRDQNKVNLHDVVLGTFENVDKKPKSIFHPKQIIESVEEPDTENLNLEEFRNAAQNDKPSKSSIFNNFDQVQEALLGGADYNEENENDYEFGAENLSIEQSNTLDDLVGSIFDAKIPQKLRIEPVTTTTPEPPITTVRFTVPETTTTQQRWIPPPTEAPVTRAPTQTAPLPVVSATFAPVTKAPVFHTIKDDHQVFPSSPEESPRSPEQQEPLRQTVFSQSTPQPTQQPSQPPRQTGFFQSTQRPQQQQQAVFNPTQFISTSTPQAGQSVFGSSPQPPIQQENKQKGLKFRKPKNRPLTKSEKLKQIQDRLKQLNSKGRGGRWQKKNNNQARRQKKLGQRVNLQEGGEQFPTPIKAAALIKSERPKNGKFIVRKRKPKQNGDSSRRGKIKRRRKKPKFGHRLGLAA